jgi:hypothetical protein
MQQGRPTEVSSRVEDEGSRLPGDSSLATEMLHFVLHNFETMLPDPILSSVRDCPMSPALVEEPLRRLVGDVVFTGLVHSWYG